MPLELIRRGGSIFRNLSGAGSLARPVLVFSPQHRVQCITFVARRSPISVTRGLPCSSSTVITLARSYATHNGPSEKAGSKSTKSTKTTKTKKTKKKAGKKPAVRKARKVLTEEQKEARAQRRKAEELKETKRKLKAAALQTPKLLPTLPWVNAMKDKLSEVDKSDNPSPKEAFSRATELARKATPEEKQRYVDQAAANKAANEAALKAWVESHTPLQILEANNARRRLAQLQGKRRVSIIHDDRLVKPPTSAWIYFFMEKRDKNALVVSDMAQDVAVQWKNLPASEKAPYLEKANADRARYEREYLEVYGQPVPKLKGNKKLSKDE
ncbi:uncharacterized protein BDW70DRAFT_666 [Aspergillus foveolatus]|uniref:uncharacterized protein n=1 Tax=Aspergillus foveolatus TaxID=210207 RepID=UPI003CCCFF31